MIKHSVTNKWEVESAEYEIMIGASSEDIRLTDTISIQGINVELPYNKNELKSYYSGNVYDVNLNEFEKLLGNKVPNSKWDRTRDIGYNDTIAQCQYAKGLFARFAYKMIAFAHCFLTKIGKRETANMIMMSVYHMPFRGVSRMTGGIVNMPMLDGMLMIVNGHFFKGLSHLLKERRKLVKSKKIKVSSNIEIAREV